MFTDAVMTRVVHTCSPFDSLERAAQLMWEFDVGSLPVLDEKRRVVGMITDRDLTMAAYTKGLPLRAIRVEDVMSRAIIRSHADTPVEDLEYYMQSAQIRRLPVVERSGELVGIVTLGDLARSATMRGTREREAAGIAETLAAITERRVACDCRDAAQ